MGIKFWLWKNFVGYVMFSHENFAVIVLGMCEFICAWTWTCRNFFLMAILVM